MATMKLGKLQEVDIRKQWSHEQYDFSEWLSKPENLEQLNEVIGLTLSKCACPHYRMIEFGNNFVMGTGTNVVM